MIIALAIQWGRLKIRPEKALDRNISDCCFDQFSGNIVEPI